jgi:hypothetical protein
MANENPNLGEVRLKDVRLSFAHLFEAQEGMIDEETGKKGEPRFGASFLMDPTTPSGKTNLANLKKAAEEIKVAQWGKNIPKLKPEKVCVRDGNLEEWDGYEGMIYCRASNKKKPVLVDRDRSELDAESGKLYSGCYVNAVVRLWAQDNKFGKRLNASLEAVQFLRHGEAFGYKQVDAQEVFDDVSEGEEGEDNGDDLI